MVKYCCDEMQYYVFDTSTLNYDDVENKVIYYSSRFREYGIPVKNISNMVATSYILIQHCPWCGKLLPSSKRDEWFEALEALGYDAPFEQEIPIEFQSSAWYAEE